MRKAVYLTALWLLQLASRGPLRAQSPDDLKLQFHGYATQGFLYTTNNNWNTTNSSDGSAAYTEAVVNVTAQPAPKLRIGVQARYFLLGQYGNTITLDWAQGDYKLDEKLGVRVGKVKTPMGLFNDTQDVDPAQLWILLPQSIYPLSSRNVLLAHFGGVAYGSVSLGERLGRVSYRAYGGHRSLPAGDGYLRPLNDAGIATPSGLQGPMSGGMLQWRLPFGVLVGAAVDREHPSGQAVYGPMTGTLNETPIVPVQFFGQYEHSRFMVAGEYRRLSTHEAVTFPGIPPLASNIDFRAFYMMGTYKLSTKLSAGLYYSSYSDHQQQPNMGKYQKDYTLAGRYDFSPFVYAKAEQHWMDGTALGYSLSNNTSGLKPTTRMTLLKLGVIF